MDLCSFSDEQEWFEFKENWYQPEELGEYVSALSNAAAFHYKKYAFFIWGVNDETHEIVGTTFHQYSSYNQEPYQNFLARTAQTMEGFFLGESIPVNDKLSEIFLRIHISEKSGRGVLKIIEMYGKNAFSFRENSIVVTKPFQRVNSVGDKRPLNARQQTIISEMRDNPNVTTVELHRLLGISETAVENNISYLKENGYIERIGSSRAEYWKVL